jgi:hypothetical protein
VLLTPVPVAAIELGELLALLASVIVPPTLPVAFGEKLTVSSADCPAASVEPASPPVTLKPVPDTDTLDTLTPAFPVFFTVTVCDVVPPTTSFPKFKLVEESEIDLVAVTPLPVSPMVSVESEALLFRVIFPLVLLADVSRKATVKFTVWPGASVLGIVIPLALNPAPVTTALEIVRLVPPLFFS